MTTRTLSFLVITMVSMIFFIISGCERNINGLEDATYPTNGDVFLDGFSSGLNYAAFGGSKVDAFDVDWMVKYKGTQSMRIAVPNFEDPNGAYAGGTFFTSVGRDLSGYDALTFWAKASKGATLDIVGFGNDFGASKFITSRLGLKLNTNWQKFAIPIPLASKLKAERGMFFYSEGPEDNFGYTIWFDEVQFEKLGTIAHPQPVILDKQNQTINAQVGDMLPIGGTYVIFNLNDGTDGTVYTTPYYYTFISSDESVATVDEQGVVTVIDSGSATITAKLGSTEATGSLTVNVVEAPPSPAGPAPTPTVPAANVISLFSNAYNDVPIDTWNTGWQYSTTQLEEVQINGDDVKLYTDLNFVGIEFASQTIDASAMDRFHIDIWTPDSTTPPTVFKIKLIDFGADGVFGGGDDSEYEVTFDENSSPALATETWVGLDVPLSEFSGLASRAHLAQMVLSGDINTVYVDNVYFFNSGSTPAEPTVPAPTPTVPASDVISMFSNAYTNVPVDTWSADWDNADVTDVQIAGDDVKLYTNLVFAGIEFISQTIDATAMDHFHMDIWTPNPTAPPAVFKIKLVDFGANGIFGGGDDVEHEITLDENTTPGLATGTWVGLDIPLSEFTGLTTRGHLAQMILSGDLSTLYVDNVYFYTGGGTSTEPTVPAPSPTFSASDAISLFSNVYTNVPVDTWSADWDNADVTDVQIAGDDVKLYTNLVFAGIEFTSQPIDASTMTHFYMDIWTPDPTAAPAVFKIKLVDFGANGVFGGGDDVEQELTFDENSTPALATSTWVNFDIPLTDFTGLTTTGHLAQLIISGDPNTVYVDNLLFHR